MSDRTVMSKKTGEVRQEVVEKIRKKSGQTDHNLANLLETTTASKISNEDFIEGLATSFPEFKEEILQLHEKIKELQEKGEEAYNFLDYFEEGNGHRKFQPRWLAEEIMDDYEFIWVRELEKLYIYKNKYWKPQGERIIEEECNRRLGQEHRENRTREVKGIIKKENSISKHEFRPPENKINFENCVYNIETGKKEDHRKDHYFTQKVPYKYDENAVCPLINDFLDEVVDNKDDKETLIEAAGYCLLPSMPISQAFLLVGMGSNGKTIYLELLKEMLGRENYKEEELQTLENTRFGTQSLYQKLALFCDDLPGNKLETGTTLKALTGGGDVRAEYKGGSHFEFKNYATPVFACNDIPETEDQSDGFFRRWKIVNFPYKFKKDPSPEDEMEKESRPKQEILKELLDEDEIKGLINDAVIHLEMVYNQGYFTHNFDPEETRKIWRSYSNPIEEFLEKYVEQGITKSEAERRASSELDSSLTDYDFDYIVKDDLLEVISKYCEARSTKPPTKSELTSKLKQFDFYFTNTRSQLPSEDDSQIQIYRGLRFSSNFWGELENLQGLQGYRNISRVRVEKRIFTQRYLSKYATPETFEGNRSLRTELLEFIEEKSSDTGIHEQELFDQFEERDENRLEEVIENLKHNGEVFEPKPGKLKRV